MNLAPTGITVNLVHPGKRGPSALTRRLSVGRLLTPFGGSWMLRRCAGRDVLASVKAANVTGVAIDASGGSIPVMFQ